MMSAPPKPSDRRALLALSRDPQAATGVGEAARQRLLAMGLFAGGEVTRRAARLGAIASLLLSACGGEPFSLVTSPTGPTTDGTESPRLVDGGSSALDTARPDAIRVVDAEAAESAWGPFCCLLQPPTACTTTTAWSCYPAGAPCAEDCRATADGGQQCTTSCRGLPTACAAGCAAGLPCVVDDGHGQTLPGTVGPC